MLNLKEIDETLEELRILFEVDTESDINEIKNRYNDMKNDDEF